MEMNRTWEKRKMCKRILIAMALLFCMSAASVDAAQPILAWCDGCTDSQKRAKAEAQPEYATVYVGDVTSSTNGVRAYFVNVLVDDAYNPPRRVKRAVAASMEPEYDDLTHALINFHNAAPVGWQKSLEIDQYPNTGINVYDVVNMGQNQNTLTDWLSTQPYAVAMDINRATAGFVDMFTWVDASKLPEVEFEIYFSDGSKINVKANYRSRITKYTVVPNSGRDSHNNTVLSSPSSAPVQFNFNGPGNPNDEDDWRQQMNLLGYNVPVEQGHVWACTKDPANGTHCVHIF